MRNRKSRLTSTDVELTRAVVDEEIREALEKGVEKGAEK